MPERSINEVVYECQRSGNCCRHPGFVRLEEGDIGRLAGFLGLDVHAFVARFTRLRPNRAGLALVDRPDGVGECVFLENNLCRAHEVKPLQCRGFPNDWNFPGWRKFCRAIPQKKLASPETRGS